MTESVKPHVDCEMVTKYCTIIFANFDKYFINLCNIGINHVSMHYHLLYHEGDVETGA